MKKLITIILAFIVSASFAQSKQVEKPKQNYFITLPAADYQQLMTIAQEYKSLVVYSPSATAEAKVNMQLSLDKYMAALPQRIKVDSVAVVADKPKADTLKKK